MSSSRAKRRRTAVNYARLHDGDEELAGAGCVAPVFNDPADQPWEPDFKKKNDLSHREKQDLQRDRDASYSALAGQSRLDVKMMAHRVLTARAGEGATLRMRACDLVDAAPLLQQGLKSPVLVPDEGPEGLERLGMRLPAGLSRVDHLAQLVGHDHELRTVDVATQSEGPRMKMTDWVQYWNEPARRRKKLLNVLSLDLAKSPIAQQISVPRFVREMDLVGRVWPKLNATATGQATYAPKVQLYALMSVAGCYTDFHLDFGGSSVWYHVISGEKVFLLAPPLPANLKTFEQWASSPYQAMHFLGDHLTDCCKCRLLPGDTFFVPGGWPHAVVTPKDSVVVGGNFLHGFDLRTQLDIWWMEERLKVAAKYRFPRYQQLMWYTADQMLRRLQPEQDACASEEACQAAPADAREGPRAGQGERSRQTSPRAVTLKVKFSLKPKAEREAEAEPPAGERAPAAGDEDSEAMGVAMAAVPVETKPKPVVVRLRLARPGGDTRSRSPSGARGGPSMSHGGRGAAASSGSARSEGVSARAGMKDMLEQAGGLGGEPEQGLSPDGGGSQPVHGACRGDGDGQESAGSGGMCLAGEGEKGRDEATSSSQHNAGAAAGNGEVGATYHLMDKAVASHARCAAEGADIEDERTAMKTRGSAVPAMGDGSGGEPRAASSGGCTAATRERGPVGVEAKLEETARESRGCLEAVANGTGIATGTACSGASRLECEADAVKDWRQLPLTVLEKRGLPALVRALRAMLKAAQGVGEASGSPITGVVPVADPERLLEELDAWAQKLNPVEKVKLKVRMAGTDQLDAAQASGEPEANNPFSSEGAGHVLTQMPAQEEVVGIEDVGSPSHRDHRPVASKAPEKKGSVRDRLKKKLMMKR